jgi:hypothetical protein
MFMVMPEQPARSRASPSLARRAARLALLMATACAWGCTSLVGSLTGDMADDLGSAILDNPDLAMVREGAPAYLILIDGLIARNPDSVPLLSQGAQLNAAYAAAFVTDPVRSDIINSKALALAERAICHGLADGCGLRARPFRQFESWLTERKTDDVPLLYRLGATWAGWIQANSDDFTAIAELARVKALMHRVIELDEGFDYGGAHLYLGVFETLLPPAMGGRPEVGQRHFERAVTISQGKYLMTQVLYAENYARLVFDRELHDRLLEDVLAADPQLPGLTLINVVAQQRATELLETADEYF